MYRDIAISAYFPMLLCTSASCGLTVFQLTNSWRFTNGGQPQRPVRCRAGEDGVLREFEDQLLWPSTAIIHHANHVRPSSSGLRVDGQEASSASIVSIMTTLWFRYLRAEDRVKPHASPVLHATNSVPDGLDESYLPRLHEFGGLQRYPSRIKAIAQAHPRGTTTSQAAVVQQGAVLTRPARRRNRTATASRRVARRRCSPAAMATPVRPIPLPARAWTSSESLLHVRG
jgi:hypothetical protein